MTRRPLPLMAAVALAACGTAGTGNEAVANQVAEADAARPVPCQVQAHAMSAVQNSLQGKPQQGPCDNSVDPQTMPLAELERIIPSQHPAFYYALATRLFAANRKEEAGFWFYAGQLRYRIRLACHPELAPDGEPALFASLSETAGAPINDFLGGDPGQWADVMRRALEWDERTPNGFEPKAACASHIAEQRRGMGQLIDHVRNNRDQIRAERAARGLPNR